MKNKKTIVTILMLMASQVMADPALYKRVEQLMARGQYPEAEQALSRSGLLERSETAALNYMGYAAMMQSQFAAAESWYRKANQSRANLVSLAGLQWALLANEKYQQSIRYGDEILQDSPRHYYARLRKAAALLGLQRNSEALGLYSQLTREFPKSGDAWYGAGLANEALGNSDQATQLYQRGLEQAPEHPGLQYKTRYATPWLKISPFASYTSFDNSSTKDNSTKVGLGLIWGMDPNWILDASVQQTITERPDGINADITLGVFSPPAGAPTGAPSRLGVVFSLSENPGGRYINDVGSLGLSYLTDSQSLMLSGRAFILQSNDPNGDDAGALYSSLLWGTPDLGLELGAAYLGFQRHTAKQGVIGLNWHIWGPFYSSTQLIGQSVDHLEYSEKRSDTNNAVSDYELSYVSYDAWSQDLGAAQQTLKLVFESWQLGIYYRGGELFTPIMGSGTSIVYNSDRLDEGYGAFIGISITEALEMTIGYDQDNWTTTSGDTPISQQTSLSLSYRF
ncbi:MAG: tetratricopeptide repeat protein [Leptospiraceae bacterium]|nr:tetratricopeptide repeat protein [Leptospiraceae bacterium]